MYADLLDLTRKSKNLYNASLYAVRQHYFEFKTFLGYVNVNAKFVKEKNYDYYQLPAKVSQQTLKLVEQNFKSFFALLKTKSIARIPRYLKKDGHIIATFTNQAISKRELKRDIVKLSGTNIKVSSKQKNIQQVRVVPKNGYFAIEIVYKVDCQELKADNGSYASIDLGLNNLFTVATNFERGFIVNGRPVKSVNQFYNKQLAQLKSKLKGGQKSSHAIKRLTLKRNNKVKDYFHKSTRMIINQLVSKNINTLIIGKNDGWKQEINLGKKTNQNFVMIPFNMGISQLSYKCKLAGINVVIREESYTSKCSFMDDEKIAKSDSYKGKRIKRGLFRSGSGKLINADLNGSLNILKKEVPTAFSNGIEAIIVAPVVLTMK